MILCRSLDDGMRASPLQTHSREGSTVGMPCTSKVLFAWEGHMAGFTAQYFVYQGSAELEKTRGIMTDNFGECGEILGVGE